MNYELYTLWAASIYALTAALKASAKASGVNTHPLYVRLLPLLPVIIGALSGLIIGPEVFGWSLLQSAFFGVGAAGVAATAHSVQKQTLRGRDHRLDHIRDTAEMVRIKTRQTPTPGSPGPVPRPKVDATNDSHKEAVRQNILADLAQIDEILSEMDEDRVIDRMSFEARRQNVLAEQARLEAEHE